ncbi:unnamed protein product [Fusarium graminearum]|nr:unnamed protein product [Fusarium graminearum]
MYGLSSHSFSSNSLCHSALHPPETFPIPKSASTFRSSRKRESEDTAEMILTDTNTSRSPSPFPLSSVCSRHYIFAALERRDCMLRQPRPIRSADDLDDIQLKRCFEILHACHKASEVDATLISTRETMEDFLAAVFSDWAADGNETMIMPKMDFVVRGYLRAGNICSQPSEHRTTSACIDCANCQTPVYCIVTYQTEPAQLTACFSTQVPTPYPREPIQNRVSPIQRPDIRFNQDESWVSELRQNMMSSCDKRVCRYNKRLAIFRARVLIRGWAQGSVEMGKDIEVQSFVRKEAVRASFSMLVQAGQ